MALTAVQNISYRALAVNGEVIYPFVPVSGTGTTQPLITYSIAPSLPAGLVFNTATGEITGKPTTVTVNTEYTITVNDTVTTENTTTVLGVAASPLYLQKQFKKLVFVEDLSTPEIKLGYEAGGTGTITYSISPSVPSGLTFTSTGTIYGTPDATSATSTYLLSIVDSASGTISKEIELGVVQAQSLASVSQPIVTEHYNTNSVIVTEVLGIGTDGYGLTSLGNLQVTTKNRASQYGWSKVRNDLNIAFKHITNSNMLLASPTTSTVITAANVELLSKYATFCEENRFECHPQQYFHDPIGGGNTSFGSGLNTGLSTRTTTWGFGGTTEITHVIEYTFLTANATRYFFNQGGNLYWAPSHNNYLPQDIDVEWALLINSILNDGGYLYGRDDYVYGDTTSTSWTAGTLVIELSAEKSTIPDIRGEIGNVITMTINFRNDDNPDLIVTPASGLWYIEVP